MVEDSLVCKKLLLSLLVLAFVTNTAAALSTFWNGAADTDWTNSGNWDSSLVPISTDWADVRNGNWVLNFPVITAAQTIEVNNIRLGPNFGGTPQTATITMDGGTLNIRNEIYIGETAGIAADFVMNSGTVNVGTAANNWTLLGSVGGAGRLLMNGGTFNAGILGLPKWWETPGTGNAIIDGGNLNTSGIIIDLAGGSPTSGIDFTKDFAAGGGKITDTQDLADPVDWLNWQGQVDLWIDAGIISSSTGGTVLMVASSVGTIRTLEIFSVAAVPGDFTGNGKVTGRDFLKWQRGESPAPLSSTDLNTWLANYGTVAGPGVAAGAAAAVPEPTSILLAAFGIVVLSTRRRLRD